MEMVNVTLGFERDSGVNREYTRAHVISISTDTAKKGRKKIHCISTSTAFVE